MRLLIIIWAILFVGCNMDKQGSVDGQYYSLLSSRVAQAGFDVDSLIYDCEQGMIDGNYFPDRSSKSYFQFIKRVSTEGDFPTQNWLIDKATHDALMNLDIAYDSNSQLSHFDELDSNSIAFKGVIISDEISSQADLSPTVIATIVMKHVDEGHLDRPIYRLMFFKFLARVYDPEPQKGLRVKLPPFPDEDYTAPINEKLILYIHVTASDSILVNQRHTKIDDLTGRVKSFLTERLVDTTETGKSMPKKIVSLKNTRGTSAQRYIEVYNEIIRAYNEVREEVAIRKYGTAFKDLNKTDKKTIQDLVPLRISETEPVEYY